MIDKFFLFIEKVLRFLVYKVFRLSVQEEKINVLIQFIKFGIIGLSNTVISYVIYIVSLMLMQKMGIFANIDYLIAQFIGFVLSVLWSFYWNNKFVFREDGKKRNLIRTLLKTYISYSFTGLFLNSVLSVLWVEVFHWSKMIAPIVNLLISVPLNFIINKFWAFKYE